MARVLLSAFSNVTWTKEKYNDSFVEGFINALIRCGNEVMNIRCNDYLTYPVNSELKASVQKEDLIHSITKFNPDIIITFNNSFPCKEFITLTNCPILLYTADGCDFFSFKELISEYRDRYVFLNLNESVCSQLIKHYPFIKDEQYCDFGYATDFRAIDIEQDINISFLGSIPNHSYPLIQYFIEKNSNYIKDIFFEAFDVFKKDVFSAFPFELQDVDSKVPLETFGIFLITTKERFEILSHLTDLGLAIYGCSNFCLAGVYNYELFKAFNFDLCVTIEQSQRLFNRSKISLNLPNARATCGFSWRVPDILASNSVLLSPEKKDLNSLMKGYAQLPTFNSCEEARALAIKLLKDEIWRRELSVASQKMIEDKCRFEDKIKTIAAHTKINLISENDNGKHVIYTNRVKLNNSMLKLARETSKMLPYFIAKKIINKIETIRT